jgi:hypothetical protein
MKNFIAVTAVLGLSIVGAMSAAESDWISLFDGRTLSGWDIRCKQADKDKVFWKVQASMKF